MAPHALPTAVNLSALSFEEAGKKGGNRRLFIKCNGESLSLKLMGLRAPFGLSVYNKDPAALDVPSLSLAVPAGSPLHALLSELEQKVKLYVVEHPDLLGLKAASPHMVEALATPVLRVSNNAAYAPTLKLKLPRDIRHGTYEFGLYGPDGVLLDADEELQKERDLKGALINACITCTGVWFIGGKFGISWRVDQLMVAEADGVRKPFEKFLFVGAEQIISACKGNDDAAQP